MKTSFSMAALATLTIATAADASYIAGRACKDGDMQGLWQNVGLTEDPAGAVTTAFKTAPYEYMLFDGRGKFAYAARPTPADVSDDAKMAAFMQEVVATSAKAGKFNDRVMKTGGISLSHNDAPWAEYKCTIAQVDSDDGDIKRDDMVWYSLDGVAPYLKRVERKISRPVAL